MLYCLEGTAKSRRRMENSRSGDTQAYPSPSGLVTRKADVHQVDLPLHQTTSIQWEPPAVWQSQLSNGEDIEKMPEYDSLAFVDLEKATMRPASPPEVAGLQGSKRMTLSALMPRRPENVRRTSDRTVDRIQVVVEQCINVDEDR